MMMPFTSGESELRELFRLRNAELVQVFGLRQGKNGSVEIWIRYQRRSRLERVEMAGTFVDVSGAIEFADAQLSLLNAAGWRRV